MSEAEKREGMLITFEGGDGAGKSTHVRFLASALSKQGYEVLSLREPGGTPISEELRQIVLNPRHTEMSPGAELMIYEAARAQLVAEVIKPAIERGAIVLCDRFTDSTIAYQVYGRGLSREFVASANAFACQGLVPTRTILLVAENAATGLERATHVAADRLELEGVHFQSRVLAGFEQLAKENPARIVRIESMAKKSETAQQVFRALVDLFPWMNDLLATPEFFEPLNVSRRSEKRA